MRCYRLLNKKTNKYCNKALLYTKNGKYAVDVEYVDKDSKFYLSISQVNAIIWRLAKYKKTKVLDLLEVETIDIRYVPIKGTIRMKNLRKTSEQKLLIEKLKGY